MKRFKQIREKTDLNFSGAIKEIDKLAKSEPNGKADFTKVKDLLKKKDLKGAMKHVKSLKGDHKDMLLFVLANYNLTEQYLIERGFTKKTLEKIEKISKSSASPEAKKASIEALVHRELGLRKEEVELEEADRSMMIAAVKAALKKKGVARAQYPKIGGGKNNMGAFATLNGQVIAYDGNFNDVVTNVYNQLLKDPKKYGLKEEVELEEALIDYKRMGGKLYRRSDKGQWKPYNKNIEFRQDKNKTYKRIDKGMWKPLGKNERLLEETELEEAALPKRPEFTPELEKAWKKAKTAKQRRAIIVQYDIRSGFSTARPGDVKLGIANTIKMNPNKKIAALDTDGKLIYITGKPMKVHYVK